MLRLRVLGGCAKICHRMLGGQTILEGPKHMKQAVGIHWPVAGQPRLQPILQSLGGGTPELEVGRLSWLKLLAVAPQCPQR